MLDTMIQACLKQAPSPLLKKFLEQTETDPPEPLPDSEHLYEAEHIYFSLYDKPWQKEERRVLGEALALPVNQALVLDVLPNGLKKELFQDVVINIIGRNVIEKNTPPRVLILSEHYDGVPLSAPASELDEAAINDLTSDLATSVTAMQEGLRLVRAIFNIHEELDEEYKRHGGLKNRLFELEQSLFVAEEKLKQLQKRIVEVVDINASIFTRFFSVRYKKNLKKQADLLAQAENEWKGFLRAKTRIHEDWMRLSEAIEQFSLWLTRYGLGPVSFLDLLNWEHESELMLPDLLGMVDTVFRQKQANLFLSLTRHTALPIQCEVVSTLGGLLEKLNEEKPADWVLIDELPLSSVAYAAILNKTKRLVVFHDLTRKFESQPTLLGTPHVIGEELSLALPELPIEKIKSFSLGLPILPLRKGNEAFNQLVLMILKLKTNLKIQFLQNSLISLVAHDDESRADALKRFLKQTGSKLIVADTAPYAKTLQTAFRRRKNLTVTHLQALPTERFESVLFVTALTEQTPRPYEFDKNREGIASLLMLAEKQFILLGRFDLIHPYETTAVAYILRYASVVNHLEAVSLELE